MTFGPIRQIGYITRDLDATVKHLVEAWGIGPWFRVDRYPLDRASYRGQEIELDLAVAFANTGPLQVEVIQQLNDGPSTYAEFLAQDVGLHVQHVSHWAEDFDAGHAEAVARGFEQVQEGLSATGPFAYYVHPDGPGQMLEVSLLTPAKVKIFGAIAEAADGWDGRDPVRSGLPAI